MQEQLKSTGIELENLENSAGSFTQKILDKRETKRLYATIAALSPGFSHENGFEQDEALSPENLLAKEIRDIGSALTAAGMIHKEELDITNPDILDLALFPGGPESEITGKESQAMRANPEEAINSLNKQEETKDVFTNVIGGTNAISMLLFEGGGRHR